ncbi:nitrate reductase cytochrome c-type subunit [Nitratifractor salsuginis]|uniref:Periplasmic nitrate reductase, electron transfer subunit n=1 Tax=Nitratifractor salsuginis (strain DSM 16511 / JCM 12458 / E9I37-1) TaxID=749222 RepID=E6X0K3_NITSE|nr:nitrate reductase cytochrome c-type subunit [Nitratifractor salsuginis]ADV46853.1 Nitrate reductase cytochrome c-type subunit (NapB) [Nitratifractor salsuginis DSM 16511]
MKRTMKITLISVVAAGAVLFAGDYVNINKGVNDAKMLKKQDLGNKKVVTEEQLSYGATNLTGNGSLPTVTYKRPAPGAAPKFERSYVNAPPLIPHSIEGLVPITIKNNQCLGCHMPNVAKSVGATPIPESHFVDFRPSTKLDKNGNIVKDGKVVANATDVKVAKFKKLKKLNPARYNCTQCHVPQANVKPLVGNTFKPDFKNAEQKKRSNLIKVIDEGVK